MENTKQYDLEERTFSFASRVRDFIRDLPKDLSNIEDSKQLVRSSGSIGANYIEANESFSKKDFVMRIKICRKEAKETEYWLKLVQCNKNQDIVRKSLVDESIQLRKIFGAIIEKTK